MENQFPEQIISIIKSFQEQLDQITQSQHDLMNAIQKAQATCISEQELSDIKLKMDKVAVYNTKLLSLKATMAMLSGRSKQLQTKANNLKTVKIQYLSQIDKIRKMEQERDQSIAAIIPSESTASLVSPTISVSSPKVKSLVKKKKRTKAREALIGEDDDKSTGNWMPKRVSSQKEF